MDLSLTPCTKKLSNFFALDEFQILNIKKSIYLYIKKIYFKKGKKTMNYDDIFTPNQNFYYCIIRLCLSLFYNAFLKKSYLLKKCI